MLRRRLVALGRPTTLQPSQPSSFATPTWEWKRDTASQARLAGAHDPSPERGSVNYYASFSKTPAQRTCRGGCGSGTCGRSRPTVGISPGPTGLALEGTVSQKPDESKYQCQHVRLRVRVSARIPPPGSQPFRATPSSCPRNSPPFPPPFPSYAPPPPP